LHQIAQSASHGCLNRDGFFSGLGGTENFHSAHGSQFQAAHGRGFFWVALCDSAGQLRGSFQQQHARKERMTREMAFQKRFIALHVVIHPCRFGRVPELSIGPENRNSGPCGKESRACCNLSFMGTAHTQSYFLKSWSGLYPSTFGLNTDSSILGLSLALVKTFFMVDPSAKIEVRWNAVQT